MNYSEKWYDFMKLATTSVLQGQPIDGHKPSIQIAIEPSFNNHVFLQLQLNKEDIAWYRTTWLKQSDTGKFNNPIENLKYTGKEIIPTIKYENGTVALAVAKKIFEFINQLSVKPQFDKQSDIVLDGCKYTLTIANGNAQTIYMWHYIPGDWSDLQILANMLSELNEKL